ncbi:MAG TPA: hypothetical protein VD905_18475, partial [Flavobacteriales bacterium]|nr:hypothetical protein [Flavobacteriales bacterium]
GTARDDRKLETITIKVLSMDGNTQIADPVTLAPSGATYTIDSWIKVGDIHTSSNNYQVIVEAYDGTNKKKAYKDIYVVEIPRVLKKMIVVRDEGTGFAVDSLAGSSFFNFINRTSDFSGASISNWHQQLYFAGKTSGVLEAWDLMLNQPKWTVPADIPASTVPLFYYTGYDTWAQTLWQSFATGAGGTLRTVSAAGNFGANLVMQPDHYAAALTYTTQYIIVAENPKLSGGNALLSYYFNTGFGLDQTTVVPFNSVKDIFILSGDELVVIGNNSSQGELRVYDKNTNGFWEQFDLPAGKVYDAVQVDAENYIIAHETGLLKYTHAPANLINLTVGNKAQVLNLDHYSGILWAGEGVIVKGYDPSTGFVGTTYVVADSVKAIVLHYNK